MNEPSEHETTQWPEEWVYSYELTWEDLMRHRVWAEWEDDDSEVVRPVVATDPFAVEECDGFKIRAQFLAAEGDDFRGCVTLCRSFGPYQNEVRIVHIFLKQERFTFSYIVPKLAAQELNRLRAYINQSEADVFPMWYETEVKLPDGSDLKGLFTPFQDHPLAIE